MRVRMLGVSWIVAVFLSRTMPLGAQSLSHAAPEVCMTGRTIAIKRVKDLEIVLMNEPGKFTGGSNDFCIAFRTADSREPIDVRSVSLDFSLLVGRIQERPIAAHITRESGSTYSGNVNLGRQYYNPAAYYAVVHYVDSAGKNNNARFHLAINHEDGSSARVE